MKVKELIKQLIELPQDLEIKVFDWRKNLHEDCGEGSREGIYNFDVELHTLSEEFKEDFKKNNGFEFKEFASITFDNIDYNSDGSKVK